MVRRRNSEWISNSISTLHLAESKFIHVSKRSQRWIFTYIWHFRKIRGQYFLLQIRFTNIPFGAWISKNIHIKLRHVITQILVNIGLGNCLLLDGTKPLPEQMFVFLCVFFFFALGDISKRPKSDLCNAISKLEPFKVRVTCRIILWVMITYPCRDIEQFVLIQRELLCGPSQWRDGVSNHQPHVCLFKAQIKENIKAPCHWLLWGEFAGEFPAQMPVTRKIFPFDDVIM